MKLLRRHGPFYSFQTHIDSGVALEFLDKVLEAEDLEEEGDSGSDYERGLTSGVAGCYQIDPKLYRVVQYDSKQKLIIQRRNY